MTSNTPSTPSAPVAGSSDDTGGDPACWAHLDDPDDGSRSATVVDLGPIPISGPSGVVWSLPRGGDLDANLVTLQPDGSIPDHVNDDVDVIMVVRTGKGQLFVDGRVHHLAADVVALIPRGAHRSIAAEASGLSYLSIHRRRRSLAITPRAEAGPAGDDS